MNARRTACAAAAALLLSAAAARAEDASPVFAGDSAKAGVIRAVEAGAPDTSLSATPPPTRSDSLRARLARRGVHLGVTVGAAFVEHSARDRFSAHMSARAAAEGQSVLQRQDPVHVYFPAGFVLGIPVTRHLDAMLRTEHFTYRVAGLAQKDNEAAREYWYSNQAHFAGAGVRWLVPVSLLTVSGQPGLYASYTRFWILGATGLRSPDGSLRARTSPGGDGDEVGVGFQQDFEKRFALTGGLAFSRLDFRSRADWSYVLPDAPPESADWSLTGMRFVLQGVYQLGQRAK